VAHPCNPNYLGAEADIVRTEVLGQPRPVSKIARTKWTGNVAQEVKEVPALQM
jgi:hypothetical protein